MVDRRTGEIFGTKSWAMINTRRQYGTIHTFNEWDWSPESRRPTPISGTPSYTLHEQREAGFKANYGPRGRPRKSVTV